MKSVNDNETISHIKLNLSSIPTVFLQSTHPNAKNVNKLSA